MAKKEQYLIVKGCAGLGNRLFAICNAIEYCKKTQRTLLVDWADGQFGLKGQNVFNEYFSIKNVPIINDYTESKNITTLSWYPDYWKGKYKEGIYDIYFMAESSFFHRIPEKYLFTEKLRMLHGYWMAGPLLSFQEMSLIRFISGILKATSMPLGNHLKTNHPEEVLIYADFTPNLLKHTFLTHIALKDSIKNKIESFALEKSLAHAIGIHVRMTDKKPTKNLDAIFEKIHSLKIKEPKIFLATDNTYVFEKIIQKYPNTIIYPKMIPKANGAGIHQWSLYNNKPEFAKQILEESIIDMWLLSKCEYLLYQGNSSFSKISQILHPENKKTKDWLA